jgi:hypothetical protein
MSPALVAVITQSPAPLTVTRPVEELTEQVLDVVEKLTAPVPDPPESETVITSDEPKVLLVLLEVAVDVA